jgi:hypothetical protein
MTMPDSREQEADLFWEALGQTDAALRGVFLDQACAGNSILRARVEELLAAHAETDRFFANAASRLRICPADEKETRQVAPRLESNP